MGTERIDEAGGTIVRLIAIELNVTEEKVRHAGSLRRDLHMDSIAAANLLFALEEEYGVELELEAVDELDTVSDIVAVVVRSQGGAHS